jgi:hypothetical protein
MAFPANPTDGRAMRLASARRALEGSSVKVTMLLADSAQVAGGKLFILGGGWSVIGPDPAPTAIAIKIEVPWDQANRRHRLTLSLLDADGRVATTQPEPGGQLQPLAVLDGEFEVGRPVGLLPGTPIDAPVALSIPPLPLNPGSRYAWKLEIDGHSNDDWHVSFTTRPAAARLAG